MFLYEFLALHKHAAGTARRVIDATFVGGEHFDQHADNTAGRVELAAVLTLRAGELRQEILIHAPEDVLGSVFGVAQADGPDEVD